MFVDESLFAGDVRFDEVTAEVFFCPSFRLDFTAGFAAGFAVIFGEEVGGCFPVELFFTVARGFVFKVFAVVLPPGVFRSTRLR